MARSAAEERSSTPTRMCCRSGQAGPEARLAPQARHRPGDGVAGIRGRPAGAGRGGRPPPSGRALVASLATTGTPRVIASRTGTPKPSWREGQHGNTSGAATAAASALSLKGAPLNITASLALGRRRSGAAAGRVGRWRDLIGLTTWSVAAGSSCSRATSSAMTASSMPLFGARRPTLTQRAPGTRRGRALATRRSRPGPAPAGHHGGGGYDGGASEAGLAQLRLVEGRHREAERSARSEVPQLCLGQELVPRHAVVPGRVVLGRRHVVVVHGQRLGAGAQPRTYGGGGGALVDEHVTGLGLVGVARRRAASTPCPGRPSRRRCAKGCCAPPGRRATEACAARRRRHGAASGRTDGCRSRRGV